MPVRYTEITSAHSSPGIIQPTNQLSAEKKNARLTALPHTTTHLLSWTADYLRQIICQEEERRRWKSWWSALTVSVNVFDIKEKQKLSLKGKNKSVEEEEFEES